MKGVVFDMLRDMVEERFSLEGWNAVLESAGSDGLYISTQTYPDADLVALVKAASDVTEIAVPDLLRSFGDYMAGELYKRFPAFFDNAPDLIQFLISVDDIVHVEVRKLYPDAGLPTFTYDRNNPEELLMNYRSPRKLCHLAEGLINGSAQHFSTAVTLEHSPCMHDGADHCGLRVKLVR